MVLKFVIVFFLGALFGMILKSLIKRPVGTLLIDKNDPGRDLYRFDIDNLNIIDTKKYILLKIDPEANLSQK